MNSTSRRREIRSLNIKSFFNGVVFAVVTVAALAAFCYLGSERLPALSTCVWRFVCLLSFV